METDQYGGWKHIQGEATGFFHVQQLEGRWWFITPEGHGFIAVGMNHDDIKIGDHNREHWSGNDRPGNDAYEYMVKNVQYLNMTAKGYGIKAANHRLPHVESLWLTVPYANHDFSSFPDVFAEDFEQMCREKAADVCGRMKDDPYLLGYYLCDCVEWPILGKSSKKLRLNWLDSIKSMGAESAGKQVYVELMKQRHTRIEGFNSVYGTQLQSFDQMLADREFLYSVPLVYEKAHEDDRHFLRLLTKEISG
jgi:hypothetical protein